MQRQKVRTHSTSEINKDSQHSLNKTISSVQRTGTRSVHACEGGGGGGLMSTHIVLRHLAVARLRGRHGRLGRDALLAMGWATGGGIPGRLVHATRLVHAALLGHATGAPLASHLGVPLRRRSPCRDTHRGPSQSCREETDAR